MTKTKFAPATSTNPTTGNRDRKGGKGRGNTIKLAGGETGGTDAFVLDMERVKSRNATLKANAEAMGYEYSYEALTSAFASNTITEQAQVSIDAIIDALATIGYTPAEDFATRPFIWLPNGSLFTRTSAGEGKAQKWVTMKPLVHNGTPLTADSVAILDASTLRTLPWFAKSVRAEQGNKTGLAMMSQELQLSKVFVVASKREHTKAGINLNMSAILTHIEASNVTTANRNAVIGVVNAEADKLLGLMLAAKYLDPQRVEEDRNSPFFNPSFLLKREGRRYDGSIKEGGLMGYDPDSYQFASWSEEQWLEGATKATTDNHTHAQSQKNFGDIFNTFDAMQRAERAKRDAYATTTDKQPAPKPASATAPRKHGK